MIRTYMYIYQDESVVGLVTNDPGGVWRFERWGNGDDEAFITRGTGFISADAALAGLYQCTMTK